eukprot:217169-Rhodomonas_salina.1
MATHHIRLLHDDGARTLAVEVPEYSLVRLPLLSYLLPVLRRRLPEAVGKFHKDQVLLQVFLPLDHSIGLVPCQLRVRALAQVGHWRLKMDRDVLAERGQAACEGSDYLVVSSHARWFVALAHRLKVGVGLLPLLSVPRENADSVSQ